MLDVPLVQFTQSKDSQGPWHKTKALQSYGFYRAVSWTSNFLLKLLLQQRFMKLEQITKPLPYCPSKYQLCSLQKKKKQQHLKLQTERSAYQRILFKVAASALKIVS